MKQRNRITKLLSMACMISILCMTVVFAAANTSHPLVVSGEDDVTVDYAVNIDDNYEWDYSSVYSESDKDAYIAGNSGLKEAGISQIAITVKEPGELSFDYEIECYSSGKNYMMVYSINEEMTLNNYASVAFNASSSASFRGSVPWASMTLSITDEMVADGSATVYIGYVRTGLSGDDDDYVAIANVAFASGTRGVSITTTGGGSVSGHTGTVGTIGQDITLTATADSGNRFYGWVNNGEYQHCESTYTFTVADDNKIEAVFAPDGTYEARGGGAFYAADEGGIEAALSAAKSGETVMLLEDATLSSSITVPTGVTLYIPFDENIHYDDETGEAVGFINGTNKTIANSSYQYVQLTVPEGKTVTVNGTLRVGGVNSGVQGGYQGHVSGAYGEIVNNGIITTTSGSTLDVLGLITGTGTVNAQTGSSVYEGFIVADYTGGTNTLGLFSADQAPFQHYAMQNIQTTFTIGSGSTLYGYCTLVTGENSHNRTIAPIMSSGDDCLFQFAASGTTVTRTYSADYVSAYDGLGQMTYTVVGGLNFQSLTMEIMGVIVSTEGVSFPIPYTYAFNLTNGDYEVSNIVSFLPGTELYVASGATLTIPYDSYRVETDSSGNSYTYFAALNIMDGLHQSTMSTKNYPYAEALEAAGYPQSAVFVVDGTLSVENAAGFCGLVQTNGTGIIKTASGALLSMTKFQLGGLTSYDDNRTYMDVSARVNTADGIGYLIAGEEYTAADGETFTQPDYSLLWMVDSDTATYESRDTSLGIYDVGYMSVTSTYGTYHILESLSVEGEDDRVGTWSGNTINYQYYVNMSSGGNSGVEVGDTITVTATVDGSESFDSVNFVINYDSNVLEYVSYGFASDNIGVNSATAGQVSVIGAALDAGAYDVPYTIGTVTFKALATDVDTVLTTSGISINPANSETPIVGDNTTLTVTLGDTSVKETTAIPTVDETTSTATAVVDVIVSVAANSDFTVNATTGNEDSPAETTVVTMPTTFVKQLDEANSLTVTVDSADVVFNSTALDEIASVETTTATLTVEVSPAGTTTTVTLALVNDAGESITFAGTGETGTATIIVPYEAEESTNVQVRYIPDDGDPEELDATYEDGYVSFSTTHFSEFEISVLSVDEDEDVLLGDVNGDGVVDIDDVTLLFEHVIYIQTIDDENLENVADVNYDKLVDIDDVTAIFEYVIKISSTLG